MITELFLDRDAFLLLLHAPRRERHEQSAEKGCGVALQRPEGRTVLCAQWLPQALRLEPRTTLCSLPGAPSAPQKSRPHPVLSGL